jgi:hypothetical protein
MPSVRDLAACIGITGNFSMLGDFFGFLRNTLPDDPTGAVVEVSVSRQLTRLEGDHFHLNIVRLGADNFTDALNEEIDYSLFKTRNIYHTQSIGVGRVLHFFVNSADANGLDNPTSKGDVADITQAITIDNDGIDLFYPRNMNVPSGSGILLGRSAVDGPCQSKKDKKSGMSGSVSGLWGSEQTARTTAHELGHYLTLEHQNDDPDNLMCQSGSASSTRNSVELLNWQGNDAKGHCLMDSGC